ncbi:MAG: glycosyltransferase family 2 protein [Beijerinckiaceae bacterium]|nr:glycosyltransferase family 2 protein [Beijerinckiaceae bacterium]
MKLFKNDEAALVDAAWYLEQYPDVKAAGLDPQTHFIKHGMKEGRSPNAFFNTRWYLAEYPDVARSGKHPVRHYLRYGAREGRDPSELFSSRAYLSTYQDVARTGMNPLLHYLKYGRHEGRAAISKYGEAAYQRWVDANDTITAEDERLIRRHIAALRDPPLISVVVPVYNAQGPYLEALFNSMQAQFYERWELCMADDASSAAHVRPLLADFARRDARVKCVFRPRNGHICAATNSALDLATGAFVALVDHDDVLPPHALYEVAAEIDAHPETDILYSDQDMINAAGKRLAPYFKTDWNLDLLLGQNMVNHLGVYRRSLVEEIGRLREGFEGSQDYDLVLRAADTTTPDRIRHIPTVLYHWRMDAEAANFSRSQQEKCFNAAKRAIEDHLRRRGETAIVTHARGNPGYTRVIRALPDEAPLVSVIIPTRDRADLLSQCVAGLMKRTDYDQLEIIIVDNESVEQKTAALLRKLTRDPRVKVLPFAGAFNYSAMNNAAARLATGEVLLLLNNDIDVIHRDWLREMVSHVVRPEVGAVGAKLYYGNGRLQHGGVVLGFGGSAGHYFPSAPREDGGYYSDLYLTRRVSAVTGACLAVRRHVYLDLGGLDEVNLKIAYNDVDFCIRLAEAGYHIVWTPYAELYHHESATRGSDQTPDKIERFKREQSYLQMRWPNQLARDPFYNPNLALNSGYPRPADTSRRIKPWLAFKDAEQHITPDVQCAAR